MEDKNANPKLDAIFHEIRSRLRDYMEAEGVEINWNGMFKCPNKAGHRHGDNNPSGSVRESDEGPAWKCHTCGDGGDTFQLASFMHGLPEEGAGFIHETVAYICEKLDIDLESVLKEEEENLSDSVRRHMDARRYLRDTPITAEQLIDPKFGRKYPKEFAQEIIELFPLICIADFDYVREEDNFLGIYNPILSPATKGSILVPIMQRGVVAGTVARNPEGYAPKYRLTSKSMELDIQYDPILNLDGGIRAAKKEGVLYVFEGVFNGIAAVTAGLKHSVATLGTEGSSLVRHLTGSGIWEIVIVFDNDQAGIAGGIKTAKTLLASGINVSFYKLGDELRGEDYDEDLANHTEEIVGKLRDPGNRIDLIEFMCLKKYDYLSRDDMSVTSKYEHILSDIAKYGSQILAHNYAEAIADAFDDLEIDKGNIYSRVSQVLRDSKSPLLHKMNDAAKDHYDQVVDAKTIEEKRSIIYRLGETFDQLTQIGSLPMKAIAAREFNELTDPSSGEMSSRLLTGFENLDQGSGSENSFFMSDAMFVGIGGKPSHAKSAFVRGMGVNMAEIYDDLFVTYFSLDDSAKRTVMWVLSSMSGVPLLDMIEGYSHMQDLLEPSRKRFGDLYGDKFVVFDKKKGGTVDSVINMMDAIYMEYPDKKHMFIYDNLYNFNEISRAGEKAKRSATETVLDILKEQCTLKNSLNVSTLELKKEIPGRPKYYHLKETGAVEYRFDSILSVFNSHKEYGPDQSIMYMEDAEGMRIPIIELETLKTKVGDPGQVFYFRLDGPTATLTPILTETELSKCRSLRQNEISSVNRSGHSRSGQHPTPQGGSSQDQTPTYSNEGATS